MRAGAMHEPVQQAAAGGSFGWIAIAASWAAATAFWIGIGATIWRLFFEPRIKELKGELADERERCATEMMTLRSRITQLETITIMHGGADLAQAVNQARLNRQLHGEGDGEIAMQPSGAYRIGEVGKPVRMVKPKGEEEAE